VGCTGKFQHLLPKIQADNVRQGGKVFCKDPKAGLFNDMSDAEAEKWMQVLECQPSSGWNDKCTYAGWKDVPSVYLVCENDAAIPPPLQMQMVALAGSEVVTCSAAHMMILSQPDTVVEVVRKAAGETL
jgi:pimeloyl-ACP methyl ester carboxylesterase